jgi:glutaredoxin 2
MLVSDFIKRLIDIELNHDTNCRYHPETGEDMMGPCCIVVDVFDDKGYAGYSHDIVTHLDDTNGNVIISAFAADYPKPEKWL